MPASTAARDYQRGLGHFAGGRRAEAETIFRGMLARHPDDPDALHMLGLIAHQEGRSDEAIELLRRAVGLQPQFAVARNNLGLVLDATGQTDEAIAEFSQVLSSAPRFADALNNLGNALRKKGAAGEAISAHRRALAAEPNRLDVRTNLAAALQDDGRLDEAIAILRDALAKSARDAPAGLPDAWNTLGNALRERGEPKEAIAALERAISLRPEFPGAFNNLGAALHAAGRADEAVTALRKALELRPGYADALSNLGNALRETGKIEDALTALQSAVAAAPEHAGAHNNLAIALRAAGRLDDAMSAALRALDLRPGSPDARNTLGTILADMGKPAEAAAEFEAALAARPQMRDACHNLSALLCRGGKGDEAVAAFRRLAAKNPGSPEARTQLGDVLREQHNLGEAAAEYEQALSLRPEFAEAAWNLGFMSLLMGDFARGWPAYEARLKLFTSDFPKFDGPAWHGATLPGRTIMLVAEQGFGDVIQFVRYAPLVRARMGRGSRVVLACRTELARLLRGQCGLDRVFVTGETAAFDTQCPLLSLPKIFATNLETIPGDVPYLSPDPSRTEAWRAKLGAQPAAVRVGLVWAGNPGHANDRNRSIALGALAPFGKIVGARFYSLQKGKPAEQAREVPAGMELVDCDADLKDFADTAALIANLDLVIAVDTAVAHLAGAMGKAVWLLLPFMPDWRWLLGRDDSPWYPTMRLFRQPKPGDWPAVIEPVAGELALRAEAGPSGVQSIRRSGPAGHAPASG